MSLTYSQLSAQVPGYRWSVRLIVGVPSKYAARHKCADKRPGIPQFQGCGYGGCASARTTTSASTTNAAQARRQCHYDSREHGSVEVGKSPKSKLLLVSRASLASFAEGAAFATHTPPSLLASLHIPMQARNAQTPPYAQCRHVPGVSFA